MSVLISGASGQIGIDLVENLSKNFQVLAIYNSNKKIKNIKNVTWIKHDFKNKFLNKFKKKPNYIIHCAVDQKNFKKNKKKYLAVNNLIMENIIDFAKINRSKIIMNLSSIDVYGAVRSNLVKETYSPIKPNIYGKMKLKSEKKLLKERINFINLRLPGVLCKKGKTLKKPWLNKIINAIKENKNIDAYNLKKKFNNIIDTNEITRLFKFIVKKNMRIRDTFNFAATSQQSLEEILFYIKNKVSSKSKICELQKNKWNSFYISLNKLEKKLNFKTINIKNLIKNHL